MATMAIVHRLSRNKAGCYETSSFTINNEFMQNYLTFLFEVYLGLDLPLEGWVFKKPFQPLVHRWGRLNDDFAAIEADKDSPPDVKQAMQSMHDLVSFLEPVLAPYVTALAETRDKGKVSFQEIWQIFPPSELIVTTIRGVPALGRVTKYDKEKAF